MSKYKPIIDKMVANEKIAEKLASGKISQGLADHLNSNFKVLYTMIEELEELSHKYTDLISKHAELEEQTNELSVIKTKSTPRESNDNLWNERAMPMSFAIKQYMLQAVSVGNNTEYINYYTKAIKEQGKVLDDENTMARNRPKQQCISFRDINEL